MTGHRRVYVAAEPDGEPSASLNQEGHDLAVVHLGGDVSVASSDAPWLRACVAAFAKAAELVERAQAGMATGITGGGDADA